MASSASAVPPLVGNASAQSCTVPNTLTNGTNADATQVMANFAAILTCLNNQPPAGVPRSYLAGLNLSTPGSSTGFAVAAGVATSDDATTSMQLAASLSKTTAAWAAGTGNGSFDGTRAAPSASSNWYHVHLIKRTDTGVVDVLTSLSATAPTLPANYSKFRRIGSMKTNGSFQWIAFSQLGDTFLWGTPVNDFATTTSTTAALKTLTVPTGVKVVPIISIFQSSDTNLAISSPDTADYPPGNNSGLLRIGASSTQIPISAVFWTNTSAQLRFRWDTNGLSVNISIRRAGSMRAAGMAE